MGNFKFCCLKQNTYTSVLIRREKLKIRDKPVIKMRLSFWQDIGEHPTSLCVCALALKLEAILIHLAHNIRRTTHRVTVRQIE